jgi:serine/threonine-protein kinase
MMEKPSQLKPEKLGELLNICSEGAPLEKSNDTESKTAELLYDLLAETPSLETYRNNLFARSFSHLYQVPDLCGNETIRNLINNPQTDVSLIKQIKNYGKKLLNSSTSKPENDAANVIYYAAIASVLVFHNLKITRCSYGTLQNAFSKLVKINWLTPDLAQLFRKAYSICQSKSVCTLSSGRNMGEVDMYLLKDGQIIRDTYEVERYLGEGAFAEVYRVQHRFLGRQAMKIFKQVDMEMEELDKMLGEATLLSRIGHPNIVRVFDANVLEMSGTTFGYFTMEYVPGGTLSQYKRSYKHGFMPVEEAVEIMKQVCSGISVAHAEKPPMIHRDIKPQNILIGYDGSGMRVRVSDFGLAKSVNPLTLIASAQGTLGFKPPESFRNMDSCSADIWALGTTLYLLLTDTLPHPSLDKRDIWDSSRFLQPLRPVSFYNIQVDKRLDKIIAKCLAKNPKDRYTSASELLKDLNSWKPNKITRTVKKNEDFDNTPADKKCITGNKTLKATIQEAIRLSRQPGKLTIAADMLEEVINKDHTLREKYESQLQLWRRGVCM